MKGEVVYLYAFDVADEIKMAKIENILADKPIPFELPSDRTLPRDVQFYKPLAIEPQAQSTLAGRPVRLLIRIYEVGVVSIAMRVSFEVERLCALLPFHKPVLDDRRTFDAFARDLCRQTCESLQDVMIRRSSASEPEAYTVFCLTQIDDVADVNAWLAGQHREAAELLTESEPGTLSETQVAEVVRIRRSFAKTDAVVVDWDAALAIDLTGYIDDVLYVLELANLQLEEYRVMDERLDGYLDRAYEDVKSHRFGFFGTYSKTLAALRAFRVDVTKLNDEVTHISKFFGDWHLARVYLGARERFYLDQWRNSVEDRLSQVDNLYTVVNSDVGNKRMLWMEVLVLIFFAVDLFAILVLKR
ncbi:MAG TPA: hypothetical protein VHX65_06135 [Pirellulales bacterium]|jgi:hypothetical protein|nr:hypothetical protein [Pirellulales bacterium]